VTALVVEHHPGTLLPKAPGDRKPDFVAAAPAVGEDHHRCIGTVALDVPHGESRPVGRPDGEMVRTRHAFAPSESETPVIDLVRSDAAACSESFVGHAGHADRRQCGTGENDLRSPSGAPGTAAAEG
jgi:hypothetical protein